MSKADELKKLKNLYDEAILTEDEYLSEKNKLLNIEETQRNENSLNDSTPQNFINSQPNIDTSHLNVSTGEASCPRCDSTRLQFKRGRLISVFRRIPLLGIIFGIFPNTGVLCIACGKQFSRRRINKSSSGILRKLFFPF
tara:strand:- start:130 stop:549 length:420 start_codon:yes stop_codon:yes gene_type:complete